MRSKIILSLFFLLIISQVFSAITYISSCTNLTTANEQYILTTNLTGNQSTGVCLNISASNIILNCNGSYLDANDAQPSNTYGIYVRSGLSDITITNCSISRYERGLYSTYTNNLTITNSTFKGNKYQIDIINSNNTNILNNVMRYHYLPPFNFVFGTLAINLTSVINTTIDNCDIYGHDEYGVYSSQSTIPSINLIINNSRFGSSNVSSSQNNRNVYLSSAKNVIIERSNFSFPDRSPDLVGIVVGSGVDNLFINYNVINNTNVSIIYGADGNVTISNNLLMPVNDSIWGSFPPAAILLLEYATNLTATNLTNITIYNNNIYPYCTGNTLNCESPYQGGIRIIAASSNITYLNISMNNISRFFNNSDSSNSTHIAGIYFVFDGNIVNSTIENNILSNNLIGIYLESSILQNNNFTISDNNLYNNSAGFYLYISNNTFIRNNTVRGGFVGFYLEGSSNNTLLDNSAYNNSYYGFYLGLTSQLLASNNNNLTNNSAYNNSYYGFYLYSSSNNTLLDNSAYNNSQYGFYLSFSSNNTLSNNNASYNKWHGFSISYMSFGNNLSNNVAHNNYQSPEAYSAGFFLWAAFDTTLINNTAYSNNYNIYIKNSNNTFGNNTHLYDAKKYDVYILGASSGSKSVYFNNLTIDNPYGNFVNYTRLDINDSVEEDTEYYIKWSSKPSIPDGWRSFENKFIDINGNSSIDYISWRWLDDEIASGNYVESKLALWKYNTSGWTMLNNTPDTTANTLSLTNMNPASDYGILENVNCPVITSPGVYTQTANFVGAPNDASPLSGYACVKIASSNVIFDCNGYNITNNGTAGNTYGILLNGSLTNVTLRNCQISNYTYGIDIYESNDISVEHSTLLNNQQGLLAQTSSINLLVNNCTAINNSLYGFHLNQISNALINNSHAISNSANSTLCNIDVSTNVLVKNFSANSDNNVGTAFLVYNSAFVNISDSIVANLSKGFLVEQSSSNILFFNNGIEDAIYSFIVNNSYNVLLTKNNITRNRGWGFYILNSNYGSSNIINITDNTLDSDGIGNGVFVYNSSYVHFENNTVVNSHYYAFDIEYSSNNAFVNNNISNVYSDGVWLLNSSNNHLYYNKISSINRYGIYVDQSNNNSLLYNDISNTVNNSIALGNSNYNNISNNVIHSGNYSGLSLSNSDYNILFNNTIYNFTSGYSLYLSTSDNNILTNNTIYSGVYGIVLVGSSANNNISYNNVTNMSRDGYAVGYGSNNNTLLFNNATQCDWYAYDIYESAYNNTLINNTGYDNYVGIYIRLNATNTTLVNNTIYNNTYYSLWISNATNIYVENDHYYKNLNEIIIVGPATLNLTRVIIDNAAGNYENYTIISVNDSVATGEQYYIKWSTNSTPLIGGRFSFAQKFIDISQVSGTSSIDSITWHWDDSELLPDYNENKFELWKYNSSGWTMLNNTPDTTANTLSLTNMNPASIYGILQNNASECFEIGSSGSYALANDVTGAPYDATPLPGKVCIKISASNVVFNCNGYSITNNGTGGNTSGILINGSLNNITIANCSGVSSYTYGIHVYQSENITIYNSTVSSDGWGIELLNSSFVNLFDNTLYDNAYSISVKNGSNNTIANNNVQNSILYNLYLDSSNFINISHNNFSDSSYVGVLVFNSPNNNIITHNVIKNNKFGIFISTDSNNNFIFNNTAYNSSDSAIRLYWNSNNTLINNSAFNSVYGFWVEGADSNNFTNNFAYNNSNASFFIISGYYNVLDKNIINTSNIGIYLLSSFYTNMSDNLIYNNSEYGIYVHGSSNNIFRYNIIENHTLNYESGIFIESSSNTIIAENNITNNYLGVKVTSSNNNLITNNNIISASEHLIHLLQSNYSNITNNNLSSAPAGVGVLLAQSNNNIVKNNTVSDSGAGIAAYISATNNLIDNNTVYNRGAGMYAGLGAFNSNNNNFTNNIVYNNNSYGIWINSSNYTLLENNTIYNSTSYGVYLYSSNYANLSKNNASNNNRGFYIESSNYTFLDDNLAYNNSDAYGFYLYNNINNTLTNNLAESNYFHFYQSSNNLLYNNTEHDSYYGFYFVYSHNNTLFSNKAYNNTDDGIYISLSNNLTLANNTAYNNSHNGFYLSSSSNNNLTNNSAYNNSYYGFILHSNSNNNILTNNSAYNNYYGFSLNSSSNNNLTNNTAYLNIQTNFYLYEADNNSLINNNASSSISEAGFYLDSAHGNRLINNTAYNNSGWEGIVLYLSNNTLVENNTAYKNMRDGLDLTGSYNSTIRYNKFHNNNQSGIALQYSYNNTIFNNTIYENTQNGITLSSSPNNTIIYNELSGNEQNGLFVSSRSDNLNISNNKISNNLNYSIYIPDSGGSNNIYITYNNVSDNHFSGIDITNCTNLTISYNIVYNNNFSGILNDRVNISTIKYNNLSNHSLGIFVIASSNVGVSNNNVSDNNAVGIAVSSNNDNAISNNVTNNILQNNNISVWVISAFDTYLANNTAYGNLVGLVIIDSNNTNVSDDHYYNNNADLFIENTNDTITFTIYLSMVKFDNPLGNLASRNYSTISLSDVVMPNESYILNWSDAPTGALPANYTSFGKYLLVTNLSNTSIDSITWHWNALEESGYSPSRFELWKYDSSDWFKVNNQVRNTLSRTITVSNLNNFSVFGILQLQAPPTPSGGRGGGGGCSKNVDINYTLDCANDVITITLTWKETGDPINNAEIELISREIGTVYLTTNASGMVSYKVPLALETMDYTIEFREHGSYCAATKEFSYVSCPTGCRDSSDCAYNEYCYKESGQMFGVCKPIKCECGEIRDHECYNYECCADSDCGSDQYCSQHVCKPKEKCRDDSCCAEDEYYNTATEKCEKIQVGTCGYIFNHKWYSYECCNDDDCSGEYKIITKDSGMLGNMHKFTITGPYCEEHKCRIGPLMNRTLVIRDPLNNIINVQTSSTGEGQFLLENKGEYTIMLIKEQIVKTNATVKSIKIEQQQKSIYEQLIDQVKNCWWLLIVILVAIVVAYLLYRKKAGEKYKFRPKE